MTEPAKNPEAPADDAVPVNDANIPDSIAVWVCGNCGSWYGSTWTPDLSTQYNVRSALKNLHDDDPSEWGKRTGPRSKCQNCKQRGIDSERGVVTFVRKKTVMDSIANQVEADYQREERSSRVSIPRST